MFVSFTVLVKVLAKGKAVPKAALGTTGRAALVTAPGERGRLGHCLAASADLSRALGRAHCM